MKKLSILFMLMGLTLSAQAVGGSSQCAISCSKCDDMTSRQYCFQNCQGQANTQVCQAVTPKLRSVTDANNFGSIQIAILKAALLNAVPTVQSVIENSGNNFKHANQAGSVDAKLVRDVQEFFQRMGTHAGKFVMNMELMAKKKGSNIDAVKQIKALFEKAVKATAAMTRQQFKTLGDLRKYANEILLNYKNIFGQGYSLKYMIDTAKAEPAKVATVKGVSKVMLCNLQCRASSCGKSASLTAKCMANCAPKKVANCVATSKKTGVYPQAEALLNITPVASGMLTPPKKELYQGEGDIGDHDAMGTGRVAQEQDAHAQRLQRLKEAREHFHGQQMNDQRKQAESLPPYEGSRRVVSSAAPSAQELDEGWIDPKSMAPEPEMPPAKVAPRDRSDTIYSPMPTAPQGAGQQPNPYGFEFDEIPAPQKAQPQLQRRGTVFSELPELKRAPVAAAAG